MKRFISFLMVFAMVASMMCFTASAAETYINMNFDSMDMFSEYFVPGNFFVEGGKLFGYHEARALQTKYVEDEGLLIEGGYTWVSYDTKTTMTVSLDDMATVERRFFEIAYCNDNLVNYGREYDRMYISFCYDITDGCFRLTTGLDGFAGEDQLLPPVYREIDVDNEIQITMGISVKKDEMRCFYNDELIFTLNNPDYCVGHVTPSPYLFWHRGNLVEFDNITVASHGGIYPVMTDTETSTTAPEEPEEPGTTAGGNDPADPVDPVDPEISDEPADPADPADPEQPDDNNNADNGQNAGDNGNNADDNANAGNAENNTPAQTNTNKPAGGNATATGDVTFVVIAVMVATLGCAIVLRKISVR